MPVPFEALLPWGIIATVRLLRPVPVELLLTPFTVLLRHWCWSSLHQASWKRGQEVPLEL